MSSITRLNTNDVFGISTSILEHSYVDRGDLDQLLQRHLKRNNHIALRGESKCGKSWLRQRNLPDAIVVQCRLNKRVIDLYVDALSQLGINFTVESSTSSSIKGSLEAKQEVGISILARLGFKQSLSSELGSSSKKQQAGHDINDLRHIAEIIKASGRRLVIEDFHYLRSNERKDFAFDMKALWDYGTYVIVIGIWAEHNLILHLNGDLAGRIHELSIDWNQNDLAEVIDNGSQALNIQFTSRIRNCLIEDSFGTVGIIQRLLLSTLDNTMIFEEQKKETIVDDFSAYESAGMDYAEQLNTLYQTFANRVAGGIRIRTKSTGIYAHMMAVVLEADDATLTGGMSIDRIFRQASSRESRIQKGNLRTILEKIDKLQIDDDGRGLIITYDQAQARVYIVDRQLFLYRKFATVKWPWETLIEVADATSSGYEGDVE